MTVHPEWVLDFGPGVLRAESQEKILLYRLLRDAGCGSVIAEFFALSTNSVHKQLLRLEEDIEVVFVGGLAAELYSENVYLTKDIDMVDISYAKPGKLHKVMAKIGFEKSGLSNMDDLEMLLLERTLRSL